MLGRMNYPYQYTVEFSWHLTQKGMVARMCKQRVIRIPRQMRDGGMLRTGLLCRVPAILGGGDIFDIPSTGQSLGSLEQIQTTIDKAYVGMIGGNTGAN